MELSRLLFTPLINYKYGIINSQNSINLLYKEETQFLN